MPKLPILIGFFLLFALTVKGQKIPAEYIKEIDTLFFNQDFEHALLLATSWESVTREKCFPPKSARGKIFGKLIQGFRIDRFCSVECNFPAAEVQLRSLFRLNFPKTKVICKIGPSTERSLKTRDGLKPAKGPLQKHQMGEQCNRISRVNRLQDAAYEPHIVIGR